MYKKLIAASLISVGLMTSAFAQSYEGLGPTNSGSSTSTDAPAGDPNYTSKDPNAAVDPTPTYSNPPTEADCRDMMTRNEQNKTQMSVESTQQCSQYNIQ